MRASSQDELYGRDVDHESHRFPNSQRKHKSIQRVGKVSLKNKQNGQTYQNIKQKDARDLMRRFFP